MSTATCLKSSRAGAPDFKETTENPVSEYQRCCRARGRIRANQRCPDSKTHPCLPAGGGNKLKGIGIQVKKTAPITTENAHSTGKNVTKKQINDINDSIGEIRRLTPIECERLQGFPDNWTAIDKDGNEISDTQRYKTLGNAVSIPVVREIGIRLLKGLEKK